MSRPAGAEVVRGLVGASARAAMLPGGTLVFLKTPDRVEQEFLGWIKANLATGPHTLFFLDRDGEELSVEVGSVQRFHRQNGTGPQRVLLVRDRVHWLALIGHYTGLSAGNL